MKTIWNWSENSTTILKRSPIISQSLAEHCDYHRRLRNDHLLSAQRIGCDMQKVTSAPGFMVAISSAFPGGWRRSSCCGLRRSRFPADRTRRRKGGPYLEPRDHENFHFTRNIATRLKKGRFRFRLCAASHGGQWAGRLSELENNPLAVTQDLSINSEYWAWAVNAQTAKTIC